MILAALWRPFSKIGADPAAIQAWLEPFGPLGPLAFFALNILQIVVAPIPGYPVQALGGILFGPILGSILTVAGLVAGGVLAAWLTRRLGRPWLEKRLEPETLVHWESIAHIDSFWTWWLILLIPLGDLPYFFAGLSHIRLRTFALAILTSRGPFTVLVVLTGSSMVNLPLNWVAGLMGVILLVVIIGFSQRQRFEAWGRAFVVRQAATRRSREEAMGGESEETV